MDAKYRDSNYEKQTLIQFSVKRVDTIRAIDGSFDPMPNSVKQFLIQSTTGLPYTA